jgi:arylamine N-acetyltransferase
VIFLDESGEAAMLLVQRDELGERLGIVGPASKQVLISGYDLRAELRLPNLPVLRRGRRDPHEEPAEEENDPRRGESLSEERPSFSHCDKSARSSIIIQVRQTSTRSCGATTEGVVGASIVDDHPCPSPQTRLAVALFEERYRPLPRGSGLSSLIELLSRFSHLPYENLSKIIVWRGERGDPLLRRPLRVMEDHLELGTGGTCFSLTDFLRHLARDAGFSCYPVMAHMRHGPNIHCALRVDVEGRAYLVDPGYLVRRPLALSTARPSIPSLDLGEPLLVPAGTLSPVPPGIPDGDFDLFTLEAEGPRWRYRFSDRPPDEDVFLHLWRASFNQPAMRSLLASSRTEEGRLLYLHNHKLRRQDRQSKSTQNIRGELEASVEKLFGIDPRVTRQAAAILQELRERARKGPEGR